ncbi:MAG: OstA-like protein, partial [Rhodothermales bacterium]|nr:OstA-like protein [Rhodothermales bacterium]
AGLFAVAVPRPVGAQDAGETDRETKRVGLSGDLMTREQISGEFVARLTGNVYLREDDTVVRANRATQYERRREILFEGNVVIFERGDTLRSRTVLYNRNTKVGVARGDVRLSDGEVLVRAPSATYYTSEKRATFTEGVTLIDSVSVLTSRTGTYWSDEKRAEFAGDVELDGTDTDVRADSLTYFRETEVSIARGNVFAESIELDDRGVADTTSITVVVGDWAYTDDQSGIRRMRDNVVLFQVRRDSADVDSLLIQSASLQSTKTDSIDLLTAAGDVRIWNTDTAAIGDSVSYRTVDDDERRELIELFFGPVGWFGTTQVSGDSLVIQSTDGSIDTLRVRQNTMLADRDSLLDRVHQVSGRDLLGLFREGGQRDMIVGPNAEAIYYLEKEGRPDGAVKTSADRIVFELQDDELKRIRVEDGVEGTYYPEDLLPAELQLAGFRWMPDRRPDRDAMLADPRLDDHISLQVSPQLAGDRLRPLPSPAPTAPERKEPRDQGEIPEPPVLAQGQPDIVAPAEGEHSTEDRQGDVTAEATGQEGIVTRPAENVPAEQTDIVSPSEATVPDTLRGDDPSDLPPPDDAVADEPEDLRPPRSSAWVPGSIDVSQGGFTIVIASRSSIKEALDLARETAADLEQEGEVVDVLKGVVNG